MTSRDTFPGVHRPFLLLGFPLPFVVAAGAAAFFLTLGMGLRPLTTVAGIAWTAVLLAAGRYAALHDPALLEVWIDSLSFQGVYEPLAKRRR
ncbi:MAG TPA: VirB3 family type IV secretion system protein [Thermoanaerobaculia bacterium]|nr:VirB3 family type IV secretion system protein [Thermoanaerobaculia bacterium]